MNTYTRSTVIPPSLLPPFDPTVGPDDELDDSDLVALDPWASDDDTALRTVGLAELMAVVHDFGDTPSGRRVLHHWSDHEALADALQLIAGRGSADRLSADPLRLAARDLAAAFGTDLLRRLSLESDEGHRLPEMVAGFVPYAHALRRLTSSETAASLTVIEQCREGYLATLRPRLDTGDGPGECSVDVPRWQPPGQLTALERLAGEVGGPDALDRLTTDPLPDEAVDVSDVAEDIHDRVVEVIAYADPLVQRAFGTEVRTAVRRLLVDVAIVDPAIFRRKSRVDTLGAGACLAVLRANQLIGPDGPLATKDFQTHFGLTSSPAHRADTLRHALVGARRWDGGFGLRSPRYLTSERRRQIIAARRVLRGEEAVPRAS